jgi:RNA polymerase sigma factor (sigma-70 family)
MRYHVHASVMDDDDDDTLLERWRAGDNRAGNALFERHFRPLLRFFRNKVAAGVEDLVQETLLACVRGRDRLRDDHSFRAYLFATARFQLYEHIRRASKHAVDLESDSLEDLAPGLSSAYAKKHEQRLLLDALRRLPIDLQVTLELYYWEGLSGPELAAALDIAEPAVRSRIRRGSARLREEIERLAATPELLASASGDLEGWLAQLREVCGRRADTAPGA